MKVYIVITEGYYDTDNIIIDGVFSTESAAEDARLKMAGSRIENFELDSIHDHYGCEHLTDDTFRRKHNLPDFDVLLRQTEANP